MADKILLLEKLVLEGFGPYQQATEFAFQPGVNLFIAPNETGKSSMAAGLTATIFGLVHRQDAAESLARYRNWAGPQACRAKLTFSLAGQSYMISRNFDNHDISFLRLGDEETANQMLVSGQHNPAATKRLLLYEEMVEEIFRINSRELFEETFFVKQPLPEEGQLSNNVRNLLTGAGSWSFQAGLERLKNSLTQLTRFLGPNDRGITSRNLGREGRLEKLEKRIEALAEKLNQGRSTADEYQKVQDQLARANQGLDKTRRQLELKTAAVAAWQDWQVLGEDYKKAAESRSRLDEAWQQLERLEKEQAQVQEKQARDFPGWPEEADLAETIEGLQELVRLGGEKKRLQDGKERLEEQLEEQGAATAKLKDELAQNWQLAEQDPVGTVAGLADRAAVFFENHQQLVTVTGQLENDYLLLERAPAEELALLQSHQLKKENLEQAAWQARKEHESAQAKLADLARKKTALEDAHADISFLERSAPTAVQAKLKLVQEKDRLVQDLNLASQQKRTVLFAGLAGLLGLAALYFLLVPSFSWPGLIGAALLGAGLAGGLLYFVGQKKIKDGKAASGQLAGLEQELAGLGRQLGSFSTAGPMELVRLGERLDSYFKAKDQLAEEEAGLAGLDLVGLAEQERLKNKALAEFKQRTDSYLDRYPDLDQALADWRELQAKRAALTAATQQQAKEPELLHLLELSGLGRQESAGQLARTLADLPRGWWEELAAKAGQVAAGQVKLAELSQEASNTRLLFEQNKAELDRLAELSGQLAAKLDFILAPWQNDPGLALAACRTRQELVAKEKELLGQKEALLEAHRLADAAELAQRLDLARDEVVLALQLWRDLIRQNPGLPQTDAADFAQIQQSLAEQKKELALLEEQLQEKTKAKTDLFLVLGRLEGQEPVNIAVAELELADLIRRREELELRADALEIAYKELAGATDDFSQTYKVRLGRQASLYASQITAGKERQIDFGDQLDIRVLEAGRQVSPSSLSKGARDQLYLAVRLAIADLLAGDLRLPLILDDPFQSSDAARRARIGAILQEQSASRQIFIFSHNRAEYGDWGQDIAIKQLV